MKNLILAILIIGTFGCSSSHSKEKLKDLSSKRSIEDTISEMQSANSFLEKDTIKPNEDELNIENLIAKWTWNDKISQPNKSSISNPKFKVNLLLKSWTWINNKSNEPLLTFRVDSLNIHNEKKYLYMVNYDSLRIFTSYDHPGDGITRGIITKLNEDSLVIKWSDDGIDKYVSIKNK